MTMFGSVYHTEPHTRRRVFAALCHSQRHRLIEDGSVGLTLSYTFFCLFGWLVLI